MDKRRARIDRKTKETEISVTLDLDGKGEYEISTGIPFFDHMLSHVAKQGLLDLEVKARGDVEVDGHHTVEDVGIALGQAIAQALGDKKGITRYGEATVPMDEALAAAAVDLSGRPYLVYGVDLSEEKVGTFDTCLAREFFKALSNEAGMNLHLTVRYGTDPHHMLEAVFKAFGRALDAATSLDPRRPDIPSTKGVL